MLAGDMLRSAADLAMPLVGVTMVHRHGYFAQRLDEHGQQHERPDSWIRSTAAWPRFVREYSPRQSRRGPA